MAAMDYKMIVGFCKVATRNLWRNKGYSALNILGLSMGICCAGMIFLWVENEIDYDNTIPHRDKVFYVLTNQMYEGEWQTFFATPGPLAAALKEEIPEVVKSGRLWSSKLLINVGDHILNSEGSYADPDMLEIFGLSFLEGSAESAFKELNSIVITKETAARLFGTPNDAIGKNIRVDNSETLVVTGVIEDLPTNFSFKFNWLVPFEFFARKNRWTQDYDNNFADTFVKIAADANLATVSTKVRNLLPLLTKDNNQEAILHSSKDWHLRSKFRNGMVVGGAIDFVHLFSIIAIIILLIACINFMNLATARSENRANEIGVRKMLGSKRRSLISQFVIETLIAALIATGLSIILLFLLIPPFNILIGRELSMDLTRSSHLFFLVGITIKCGILAGLYPAFYLSSFKPLNILKGVRNHEGSAIFIRKTLVIIQFAFATCFIISTIIIYKQIQHIRNRDLGFQKENLIQIPVNGTLVKNFDPLKMDLLTSGFVEQVAMNSSEIFSSGSNGSGLKWQGGTNMEEILIRFRWITPDFFKTVGMEIVEGRNFNGNMLVDSTHILITQSFAKLMGRGSAIGKIVTADKKYTVIGVVSDYLYGDMYGASQPLMFLYGREPAEFLYVKIKDGIAPSKVLNAIQETLKRYNPAFPFEYKFVTDIFDSKFKREVLMGNLSKIFAFIAIVISCLGLFGLSAFTAEQRKKEIGIRKVLGSSVYGIVSLLSKEFLFLVVIAVIIAIPITYWALREWLLGFAYRVEINLWVFVCAGFAAIGIALFTISFQAIKAGIENPVKSLRTE